MGDAAHPLRPTGEGTALAFEDAWVLGHLAAAAGPGPASGSVGEAEAEAEGEGEGEGATVDPKMLREFEALRKGRVQAISEAVKAAAEKFYKTAKDDSAAAVRASPAEAMRAHPMQYGPL